MISSVPVSEALRWLCLQKSGTGVLAWGGIFFGVGNTNIGPFSNETWLWPEASCPSAAA